MIYRYKPRYKSLSYITVFSEKVFYFIQKETNIKRRDLTLLLLCYQFQQETNKLITCRGLRPYAPFKEATIYKKVDYYNRVGYLERVEPMKKTATDRNKYYNCTPKLVLIVNKYETMIGELMKQFEDNTPKFKKHSDKLFNYYDSLGIVNAKINKNRNDDGPTADG